MRPEKEYAKSVPYAHRKEFGQFFTPLPVAQRMSEWILANPKPKLKLLDPAAGLGIFPRTITPSRADFDLYEIDPAMASQLAALMDAGRMSYELHQADYLLSGWDKRYDGVIANPPYYKHHHLTNKADVHRIVTGQTGFRFGIKTNVYCWFLIKAINQLKPGGRLAFIVPSEFLNSNYGEQIKAYLLQSGLVLQLIAIDFKAGVFDDAQTTSVIILGTKSARPSGKIDFYHLDDAAHLSKPIGQLLAHNPKNTYAVSDLDPHKKWRPYFLPTEQAPGVGLVPLSTYGRFKRGIATGANGYFTLSRGEAKRQGLPDRVLVPCVTRAAQARGNVFSRPDFGLLADNDAKVFLFDGGRDDGAATKRYIKAGEAAGVDQVYLTKQRKPWYAIENKKHSRIWSSVFGRQGLRFIWNTSDALTLSCFHNFYPTESGEEYLDILFLYLNTPLAQRLFQAEKREYGGGLEKFEPNDINKSGMADLSLINQQDLKRLRQLQRRFIKGQDVLVEADAIFRKACAPTPR